MRGIFLVLLVFSVVLADKAGGAASKGKSRTIIDLCDLLGWTKVRGS